EKTAKQLGEVWPVKEGKCYLLVIVAEQSRDQMLQESLRIAEMCQQNGALEPLFAEPRDQQERILRIRSNIYLALKPNTADILDTTVPPANIGKFIDEVDRIAEKYNAYLPAYGHAGDGNLHIHIMDEGKSIEYIEKLRNEIYDAAFKLGGVITGEHGIGRIRKSSLTNYMDKKQLELMKKIKEVFDPNNILNPGAVIPL
ncbi:MAG: FAD-binding oxidoreductase, partial [archaeon GB-1867-035]|nr:FAD-binding oxidoreductase [Candidatus Culexmicrobium profundum]